MILRRVAFRRPLGVGPTQADEFALPRHLQGDAGPRGEPLPRTAAPKRARLLTSLGPRALDDSCFVLKFRSVAFMVCG